MGKFHKNTRGFNDPKLGSRKGIDRSSTSTRKITSKM